MEDESKCVFVYSRSVGEYRRGMKCLKPSVGKGQYCSRHRKGKRNQASKGYIHLETALTVVACDLGVAESDIVNGRERDTPGHEFPITFTDEEEQKWVTTARGATSASSNARIPCLVCGRLFKTCEAKAVGSEYLCRHKVLLGYSSSYPGLQHLFEYESHPELNGMVLDRNGFVRGSGDGDAIVGYVCNQCNQSMCDKTLPSMCLANGLWTGAGSVPELRGLTWLEEKAIARVHVSVQMLKCRRLHAFGMDKYRPQRSMKGNIITFPMDPTAVVRKLPLAPAVLRDVVKIVFVTSKPFTQSELRRLRFCHVRRGVIETALKFLISNNPLYGDVELDLENLAKYPESDSLDDLLQSISVTDRIEEDALASSSYDKVDDNEPEESVAGEETEADDCTANLAGGWDMQCCGIIDVDGEAIPSEEKFFQALNGLYIPHDTKHHDLLPTDFPPYLYRSTGNTDTLLVRTCSSVNPSNEYDAEHLMEAFPTLFPYGIGGFQYKRRRKSISWNSQFKYLLQQSSRLFGRHEVFMFVTFNILQRRAICLGAKIVAKRSKLQRIRNILGGLDAGEVRARLSTSTTKGAIDDPQLLSLWRLTQTANALVRGSKEYARDRRSEIRGLCVRYGVPSFFITINPDDVKHPLVVELAGRSLDFGAGMEQYLVQRFEILATDPVAQAEFFDVIITSVVDHLIGLKNSGRRGVFGRLASYYGMIEAQGKGTLHLHCLVWLVEGIVITWSVLISGLGPDDLRVRLEDVEFRGRLLLYLEKIVKQGVEWGVDRTPGFDTAEHGADSAVSDVKNSTIHPSFQFPEYRADPDNWRQDYLADAEKIAKATQRHRHTLTCKKKGTLCRFGFPREVMNTSSIDLDNLDIILKRTDAWINNHTPSFCSVTRSNHDVQPVFTKGLHFLKAMYYMTLYLTKSEDDTSDAVVFETAMEQLEKEGVLSGSDCRDEVRRLLIRMNNMRGASVQFSGAQIAAMVLGIGHSGTHYTDVTFTYVNLRLFLCYVRQSAQDATVLLNNEIIGIQHLPEVDVATAHSCADDRKALRGSADCDEHDNWESVCNGADLGEIDRNSDDENEPDGVSVEVGDVVTGTAVEDYIYRGTELEDYSLYEMSMSAVAEDCTEVNRAKYREWLLDPKRPGRPWHQRVFLKPQHRRADKRWIRMLPTDRVPCVYGPRIPHTEEVTKLDDRAELVLILFKPWRVYTDLRTQQETWPEALLRFETECESNGKVARLKYIRNVDYLSKSRLEAEADHKPQERIPHLHNAFPQSTSATNSFAEADQAISVEDYLLFEGPRDLPSHEYVRSALSSARMSSLLPSFQSMSSLCRAASSLSVANPNQYRLPTEVSFNDVDIWKKQIEFQKHAIRARESDNNANPAGLACMHVQKKQKLSPEIRKQHFSDVVQQVIRKRKLNDEQALAFTIFLNFLKALEFGEENESEGLNRCLYLGGAGGTGKSEVIQAVEDAFEALGHSDKLLVSATTGVAAQLIGGSTIDSLCKFSKRQQSRKEADGVLHLTMTGNYWMACRFLILDEVSMMGCSKLHRISKALCKFKGSILPFGGLYVMFCGDFQQLKPVRDKPLFKVPWANVQVSKKTTYMKKVEQGYFLWQNVTKTTVMLRHNYRAKDPALVSLLNRVARGEITSEDKQVLNERVIGHGQLGCEHWRNAVLITPRNTVRQAFNNNRAVKHLHDTKHQIFVCPARDEGITCSRLKMVWTPDSKTDYLPTWNVLSIEAPGMITANAAVELGIANGTDVVIKEVIPHPQDSYGWSNIHKPIVKLGLPPMCVFVEPISKRSYCPQYHPVQPTWFPIFPITTELETPLQFQAREDKFTRTQIPLLLAFAVSDFRVQGKTIKGKFLLDLYRPPTGNLDLQNIYVMLSRMVNLEDMAILRQPQSNFFDKSPDPAFFEYEKYLDEKATETAVSHRHTLSLWLSK